MLSKTQIMIKVISIYANDTTKRAVSMDTGQCLYYDQETGNRCAVGLFLDLDEETLKQCEGSAGVFKIKASNQRLEDVLLPEVQGHTISFWHDLQRLHDCQSHWNDDKDLSHKGYRFLSQICEMYNIKFKEVMNAVHKVELPSTTTLIIHPTLFVATAS